MPYEYHIAKNIASKLKFSLHLLGTSTNAGDFIFFLLQIMATELEPEVGSIFNQK